MKPNNYWCLNWFITAQSLDFQSNRPKNKSQIGPKKKRNKQRQIKEY